MLSGLTQFKRHIERYISRPADLHTNSDATGIIITLSYRVPPAYQWENGIPKEFYVFAKYKIKLYFNGGNHIGELQQIPIPVNYPGLTDTILKQATEELINRSEKYTMDFKNELSIHSYKTTVQDI